MYLIGNNTFAKILIIISSFIILILSAVSITMIKTSFSISYSDRIKELGMLTSIGMNNKQRNKMIKVETIIIAIIAITIGLILGTILSLAILQILNNYISHIDTGSIIKVDRNLNLTLKVPYMLLILVVIIVWIIIRISSILSIRKIDKITPMEAIRDNINLKIDKKQIKIPWLIKKLFKEEGKLAYKNIKRNKSRYNTVTTSLTISLILFLSINGIILNVSKKIESARDSVYDDYIIEISEASNSNGIIDIEKTEKISKYLQDNKLAYDSYGSMLSFNNSNLELKKSQVSEMLDSMIMNQIISLPRDIVTGAIQIELQHFWAFGKAYDEILKKAGVSELKENEVIITNSITEETKFGDKINITNFKVGDTYTLDMGIASGKKESSNETFKIARNS